MHYSLTEKAGKGNYNSVSVYNWNQTIICHQSKKIGNDQELIQSDAISCPQNLKVNNFIHKLTAVYERHARLTEWTAFSQTDGHSATLTKYVTPIIGEPKYKYGQQEQVAVRNHNRSNYYLALYFPFLFRGTEM